MKNAIAPSYKTILSVFNFYCLTASSSARGAFSIQPNQFTKMVQDAELTGSAISVEEVSKIFVLVNFESDKVGGALHPLGHRHPSQRHRRGLGY